MSNSRVELTVNGHVHQLVVATHHSLLDVVRDQLHLTGSKECCAEGECGACTVFVEGRPVNACLILAVEADGLRVTTIEGLATDGDLTPLQHAFLENGAVQCGFCIPGMVMSAQALLDRNPQPSEAEVREGLSGNLCRCAGYNRIVKAVLSVANEPGP